jgi:hypothetical protein
MLYKFKSKATGDLIMLQPNGERMLEIIGKHSAAEPSVKGILLTEQMPQALEALRHAINQEEAQRQQAIDDATRDHKPTPKFEAISLRQRALPFMDMVRACQKEDAPITWGV